ncbi:MAG: SAM-dependent methyltransferase [Candidatus Thiodiazotropha sp.]
MECHSFDRKSQIPLSAQSVFQRMNIDPSEFNVQQVLGNTKVVRQVLQDFCPLAKSLEWELASLSWNDLGTLPFAKNEVPFFITNSGLLSEHAAVVLFESCKKAPPAGQFHVLELGAGAGLFAQLFLEHFKALCQREEADYYDQLIYIVSDGSERTIEQWRERAIFENHAEHVKTMRCNARVVEEFAQFDEIPLRAVMGNYVLDVLPSTIIRQGDSEIEELNVRTHLVGDSSIVSQHTDLRYQQISDYARSQDLDQRRKLLPLVSLLELETSYKPIDPVLYDFAQEALRRQKELAAVVINYGAMACLGACINLLEDDGFILVNDYGLVDTAKVENNITTKRFGPTMSLGVNFPLLEAYMIAKGLRCIAPDNDLDAPIHSRLIARDGGQIAHDVFNSRFGRDGYSYFQQPILEAREHARAGRKSEALEAYKVAISRNQADWYCLGEAAEYIGLHLANQSAATALVQEAVRLNPWYSPWLWNVLGECLFAQDRFADAHEAYLQAQRIDPKDIRTNLNLSFTYARFLRFDKALEAIACGLSYDKNGVLREKLLEKQYQILNQLSLRDLGERERLSARSIS